MLEALFGSINRENVLIFLFNRKEGYAREISRFFNTDLNQIQKQLERLEAASVLYSRNIGKTRIYGLNPQCPFLNELQTLLDKANSYRMQSGKEKSHEPAEIPQETINRYESYDPDLID